MVSGLNFWDNEIWVFATTLAVLFAGMLLANVLRLKLRFLRRTLIPSPVLGGFLVLAAGAVYQVIFKKPMLNVSTLEALTYHGLGIGFVALAWRKTEKLKGKKARRDTFNTSTIMVGGYLIQGVVGLLITVALHYMIGSYAPAGALLPMGYGQGPGQAYSWGHTFEMYTEYEAFTNGTSFGLTVAAMGFVAASVGGVIYLKKLKAAGSPKVMADNAEEYENLSAVAITGENEIPISESMDKLTVQAALVFVTYAASYGAMKLLTVLMDAGGGFLVNTVKPLLWGFNFLTGTAMTLLFKAIYNSMRRKGTIKREYINNFLLNRLSGVMFDLMVVASIAAINLSAFSHREFVIPLILICIAGAVVTYFYTKHTCDKLFPTYNDEMFMVLYGTLTGTASTGMILLRETDRNFETLASHNAIYQNLWSILLGAPILLLIGFVARSMTWTWITIIALALLFAGMCVLQLLRYKAVRKDP